MAFLSGTPSRPPARLTVVGADGEEIAASPLREYAEDGSFWAHVTWIGGGRYLLLNRVRKGNKRSELWSFEKGTGAMVLLRSFRGLDVKRVEGFGSGGYVVHRKDTLYAYDAEGEQSWSCGPQDGLCRAKDMAVLTDGSIAVLDSSQAAVQVVDESGKPGASFHLDSIWVRKPNYVTDIASDHDGGFVVQDNIGGMPRLVRMHSDGSVFADFRPRFADGKHFDMTSKMCVDPEGQLWTTDGRALLRLDEKGTVVEILGEGPSPERIGEIATLALGNEGRIYVVSVRTGVVHVLDDKGQPLHRCVPAPSDFDDSLNAFNTSLAVTADGSVLLSSGGNHRFVRYSPAGERLDAVGLGLDSVSEEWYARHAGRGFLVVGYEKAFLVDGDGRVDRVIDRRPDGNWLTRPGRAAVAADGSFALIDQSASLQPDPGERSVVLLYDADGEGLRCIDVPSGAAEISYHDYDGQHLVVNMGGDLHLLDSVGNPIGRLGLPPELADERTKWWRPLLPAGRQELWLFDGKRTIHRFALPD